MWYNRFGELLLVEVVQKQICRLQVDFFDEDDHIFKMRG